MIDGVASPPFLIAFTLKHRAVSGGITLAVTKDNVAAIPRDTQRDSIKQTVNQESAFEEEEVIMWHTERRLRGWSALDSRSAGLGEWEMLQ
jgi:hypothetical protein